MKKETLTLTNIKQDLRRIAYNGLYIAEDHRLMFYIAPSIAVALVLMLTTGRLWLGLLPLPFMAYHLLFYVTSVRAYLKQKKAIKSALDRSAVSVSIEKLCHISEEAVYQPHVKHSRVSRKMHFYSIEDVTVFHFESGAHWSTPRMHETHRSITERKHYEWSRELSLSKSGLENISLPGDEFFYITLQGYPEIAYIYPCKFFELGDELKAVVENT